MSYQIEKDIQLSNLTTMGVKTSCDYFVSISSTNDLKTLLDDDQWKNEKKLILGGGSNILFTGDFNGLIIKNDLRGIEILKEDNEHVWVKTGAGENWHDFVLWAIDQNYGGIENLSLIPGTVGAAPMQNIGAYGVEIREVFDSLVAMEIETGILKTFENKDCEFGYRSSVFKTSQKGNYIICSVTIRLSKSHQFNTSYGDIMKTLKELNCSELSIRAISDAVIKIRQSKLPDPVEIGNAGSFFKNPVIDKIDFEGLKAEFSGIPGYEVEQAGKIKVPAGWLIEQCGWKGKRIGETGVHENQALVLVNYGGARGEDIQQLAYTIRESVRNKFGILIEPEVNMI